MRIETEVDLKAERRDLDVRWFPWWQVQAALAHGRAGGIALHYFHYDLRRFGLGSHAPCCHIISADRDTLVAFGARFGLPEWLLKEPRPHRPDIWHFDAFGWVLDLVQEGYPLPEGVDLP